MRRTKTKPTCLPLLGSVSAGTLVTTDLLEASLDLADSIRLSRSERADVRAIGRRFAADTDADPDTDTDQDQDPDTDTDADRQERQYEDLAVLQDILNSHVPDYCYFGAHEGDGADFGVWVDWPTVDLERDRLSGGIANSRDAANVDPRQNYWIDVNDHGNATLYRRVGKRDRWVEVWSVV